METKKIIITFEATEEIKELLRIEAFRQRCSVSEVLRKLIISNCSNGGKENEQ